MNMIETLDIFKVTDDIVDRLLSDGIVNNVPKRWFAPLYLRMLDAALEMHTLVYYANTHPEERADNLKHYLGQLHRLKSLTRHAHKRRIINNKQDAILNEMYESVSRQATAWRKKAKRPAGETAGTVATAGETAGTVANNTSYDRRESQG